MLNAMLAIGIGSSPADGGNELISEKKPIDPAIMESTPERVKSEAIRVLDLMRDDPAHILNLGHGIRPNAKIGCMEALVETNQSYR